MGEVYRRDPFKMWGWRKINLSLIFAINFICSIAFSYSTGFVDNGYLIKSSTFDSTINDIIHFIYPKRNIKYGTEDLIKLLTKAAYHINKKYPKTKLVIGNISNKHGGFIPYSVSHQSGRDADIGFYLCNEKGTQVIPKGYISFDSSGKKGNIFFDIPKNWELIKFFLNSDEPEVQWIFISNPLKKLLIDYAKKNGEPEELIIKAEYVIKQPSFSNSHNDHIHLRIYCSEKDINFGCIDYYPFWGWLSFDRKEKLDEYMSNLIKELERAKSSKERKKVIKKLKYKINEKVLVTIFEILKKDLGLIDVIYEYLKSVNLKPYISLIVDFLHEIKDINLILKLLGILELYLNDHLKEYYIYLVKNLSNNKIIKQILINLRKSEDHNFFKEFFSILKEENKLFFSLSEDILITASYIYNRKFKTLFELENFLLETNLIDKKDYYNLILEGFDLNCNKNIGILINNFLKYIPANSYKSYNAIKLLDYQFNLNQKYIKNLYRIYRNFYHYLNYRKIRYFPCNLQ